GGSGDAGFTSEMHGETFFYSGHEPREALQLLAAAGFEVEHWEVDDPSSRGHIAVLAVRTSSPTVDPARPAGQGRIVQRPLVRRLALSPAVNPIPRRVFETRKLVAEFPPRFSDRNKRTVHDIACPPGAAHGGRIVYSRWGKMDLPAAPDPGLPE